MSRRKKGNPVHGWLILDKPLGMTSTQAVGKIKWLYQAQKAGHAGTLDPLATGILPIALGEATKTVSFAVDGEKAYRFSVRWGAETNTDDAEGRTIATSEKRPTIADIEALLPDFIGEVSQVPPQFSAIKIDGNRAYDLAREGEDVPLEARVVVIESLRVVEQPDDATTVFEAECGKGTYVRAIARDLGRRLGCHGHVVALRRTRVGPFSEDDAIALSELVSMHEDPTRLGELTGALLPVETALEDLFGLQVSSSDAARLARGQSIILRGRDAPIVAGPAFALCKGQLVAMGDIDKAEFHPTRVFNLGG
jgi:tRNA pseudouridine55 synthase